MSLVGIRPLVMLIELVPVFKEMVSPLMLTAMGHDTMSVTVTGCVVSRPKM